MKHAMGISLIALLMMTGTLSLREISLQQPGMHWNVFTNHFFFFHFLICALQKPTEHLLI
jgi:NADH-quinone oxidoreductase subunit H